MEIKERSHGELAGCTDEAFNGVQLETETLKATSASEKVKVGAAGGSRGAFKGVELETGTLKLKGTWLLSESLELIIVPELN